MLRGGRVRSVALAACALLASATAAGAAPRPRAATDKPTWAPRKGARPAASPELTHQRARAFIDALEYEKALPLLRQLAGIPGLPAALRVAVLVDLGVTYVNVARYDDAHRAFDEAIALDPAAAPPADAAPKIRELFAAARAAKAPPPPPPAMALAPPLPVSPAPPSPPTQAPSTPVAPTLALAPSPPPGLPAVPTGVESPPPSVPVRRSWILPATSAVLAAGAAAGGFFAAAESRAQGRALRANLHESAELDALVARQQTMATMAVASYAGAGVFAALAAVLFLIDSGGGSAAAPSRPAGSGAPAVLRF